MATININITLDRDEINEKIPFALICEVRYGNKWNSSKTKREYEQKFSTEEREEADNLFKLSHKWYLVSGVPERVTMPISTLSLWMKLAEFCIG